MPTSPYFPSYYQGHPGEQNLAQDLADEQIKLFGTDIYYMPRTILRDNDLGDIIYSKYQSQFQVEMLLQNVEGFGNNAEFISKFGLRLTDEITFVVSSRRWAQSETQYTPTLTVPGRPNEGDLLFFPLTKNLYEIKFVERRSPFFQFGKLQFMVITAEIYEMGDDKISTGNAEIDEFEKLYSSAIAVNLKTGGTGIFTEGETVTGGTSGVTGIVKSWNPTTRVLQVVDRTGTFVENETVTGNGSGAVWNVGTFDTLNNTNSIFDQNRQIEDKADDIVDWTERNPFGEYGNHLGSL